MKLTNVELAQCGDALRIAGVPERIVEHLLGLETRRRVIATSWTEPRSLLPRSTDATIENMRHMAYQDAALDLAQRVVRSNLLTISPPLTTFTATRFELVLEVLEPAT